ncbi:hypothetical protein [Antribacter gilvus]|uniref:hypothetical protein n=1 Tax=Antribacter gilvus TaxID=2304675 RepID=UPI000F77FA17|nr:hypothetical protein [Antribacter gilvus]
MSERQFIEQFTKRPGMWVGLPTWGRVVGWLLGYEANEARHGGPGFDGFREWLLVRSGGRGSNLGWPSIAWLIAFPDPDLEHGELGDFDQEHAKKVLFELLDEFLAEREGGAGPLGTSPAA